MGGGGGMGGGECLEGAEDKLHIPHFLVSTGKASRQMKSATRHPAMTTGTYVVIPLLELGCDKCKCYSRVAHICRLDFDEC